jgi:uncharacterized protein
MPLTRRQLLHRGAAGAAILAVGDLGSLAPRAAAAGRRARTGATPGRAGRVYGQLVPDPAKLLDLPDGFSYTIVSEAGQPLTGVDGLIPDRFDGTAFFHLDGRSFLVRNSEQSVDEELPATAAPELTYDPIAQGGTTTVELGADGSVIAEYVSLAGTVDNCAGGPTPWGTWLSCEETEDRAGDDGLTEDHGFVFEVDPLNPDDNTTPTPLTALGRFPHEAVSIDPDTGTVYLTEDANQPHGLLYRARPTTPLGGYGSLRDGAVLEAMVASLDGGFIADLSEITDVGTRLDVTWSAIPDPSAEEASTRVQLAKVTRSRKLEGTWWGTDGAYFAASYARRDDGSVSEHDGQVWKLDPTTDTVELVVLFPVNSDPDSDTFDGPDNITVAPNGGLILCADGEGVQHLWMVSPTGEPSMFARNARDDGEFTGATFSADGTTLYVNLQQPGVTFAITGPWA